MISYNNPSIPLDFLDSLITANLRFHKDTYLRAFRNISAPTIASIRQDRKI